MNERLQLWEAERDRVAAGIRHDRINAQEGSELLALCDERIREHRDGVVPEADPEPAAVVASIATPRAAGYKTALQRQRELRKHALAKYRADMQERTGRKPGDTAARLMLAGIQSGQCRPIGVPLPPWMLADQDHGDTDA